MAVAITRTADPASTAASISSNTATYTGLSTGTAASDRLIAVVISWEFNGTPITGVTIGGYAATAGPQVQFSTTVGAAIYWRHHPIGTTADVAVTWTAAPSTTTQHISVYAVTGANIVINTSGTNTSTDMDVTTPLSLAIVIPTNGGALAIASGATGTSTAKTWANITEDLEINVNAGGFTHTTATRVTSGSVTITCTGTTNQEDGALAAVTFQPTSATTAGSMVDGLLSWTKTAPYPISLRTWALEPQIAEEVVEAEYIPARIVDWGMWLDPRVAQTWIVEPQITEPVVSPPIVNDWPLPRRAVWPVWTWTQATPPETANVPSQVLDWGVPDRVDTATRTWTQAPQLAEVIVPPAERPAYNVWQLPIAPARMDQTWTQEPFSGTPVPSNQYSWVLPIAPPRIVQTWAQAPFQATPVPSNQYSWTLPVQPFRPIRTWTQAPFSGTPLPVSQYDWPLAIRSFQPVRSYGIAPQQAEVVVAPSKPVNPVDWPLPTQPIRPAQTWARAPFSGTPLPVSQYNWPLPIQPARPQRSYTVAPQPAEVVVSAKPINQSDWPLPVQRVRATLTWTQAPQTSETITIPGGVVDWGDTPDHRALRTWTRAPQIAAPVVAGPKPINQSDWPLPIQPNRRALTFVRGALGENPFPVNQYDWPNPIPPQRPIRARTWTWGPHTSLAPVQSKPVNQADWPLPIRRVPIAQTWTRSPIFTAPVIRYWIPCRIMDWGTTPAVRITAALTWTQGPLFKPAAPPLPKNQYYWPNPIRYTPRAITFVRGPVGFTRDKPPTTAAPVLPIRPVSFLQAVTQSNITLRTPPVVVSTQPVNNFDGRLPVRRTPFTPANIANRIALTTPPLPLPNNQYSWPIPIARSRKGDGYSYTFSPYTGRMSPANMPPRTGMFGPPPPAPYFSMSLRTIAFARQLAEEASAPSPGGIPHNIPFIATMGAMTAR